MVGSSSVESASTDANVVYALRSSEAETDQLRRQAEELGADSAALLDRVGLGPGQRCIDLGCGPRGVLDLMAGRVAPGGTVVGVDANPNHVTAARKFIAARGLAGVDVVAADARDTGLPAGSFDVVHARTLLITIPDRPRWWRRWCGSPGRADGWSPSNPTRSTRCANRRARRSTGSGPCSRRRSVAMGPIR
jgi:precorrin-6B methylase 2